MTLIIDYIHWQIQQDTTACEFVEDNAIHFVLTGEALQMLIDNHSPDYEKDWELPVTVVERKGLLIIY